MISGFVLAVPVFFDTVFYLLVPLARSLYRRTNKNYLRYLMAIATGGAITHTLVPPTPGPLLVAAILGVEIGMMMLIGTLVAIPCAMIGLAYSIMADKMMPVAMRSLGAHENKHQALLAVYALIRGFAGFEPLIWIGCAMTLFPIFYAVIENDLRRVLAYSLNNQLGFMVVGIGIGTELAINGTVAHAFCHIIYKALLFMSMGAVLYRVGTTKATELGGLYKSMPLTTIFCIIGAGSISGFPLLSGFISKSMIVTAAAEEHQFVLWILLLVASAGVMEHSGIKIPFFAFFAHDSGKRVKEAPWNMLVAMAAASFLCIALGIAYPLLYGMLPYSVNYPPYTVTHVVTMLQLLLFAGLAFVFLIKTGLYPNEVPSTNLDSDWFYRRLLPRLVTVARSMVQTVDKSIRFDAMMLLEGLLRGVRSKFSETGLFGRTWSTSMMTFWATILLAICLLLYYF